ncbi:primosomal protein DnaI [Lacticaseibacillus nasuensis]|uniref:primosomal protein DnaI n=1 Tax=Lacticaseibacillus nasuensis TaxID=944671 RepID=UPI00224873B2|nr:primosomal protein DnaI [Lacticaseibacillus nasuensis]MCX2455018.1 primosomal protein DnaI [Lacticaseibacillus nasuensis]
MKDMRGEIAKLMDARQMTGEYAQLVQQAVADPAVQQWLHEHEAALAPDAVTRGAAKIYEYVSQRDAAAAGKPVVAPGYAPQLVVSNRLIDITYQPTAAMVASQAAAKRASLVTAISMPKANQNASFATYDSQDRDAALSAALAFVSAMLEQPQQFHKGLYLTGAFGVGKTYLLGAIANELASQGIASTLVHVPTYSVELKAAIATNGVPAKVNALKRAPVLMLDDIGAESLSPWFRDDVLGIILQYRMQEELPTLFSSNKTMAELTNFLAGVEVGNNESLKASRIMERVKFLATEIVVGGRDRRNG